MGEKKAACILILCFCSMLVTHPSIELVMAIEPPFWNIEPNEAHPSSWDAPPEVITESITVIIVTPEKNRTYTTNNVTLMVNIGTQPIYDDRGGNTHYIRSVLYKADWMESAERIFYHLATYEGKWFLMPKAFTLIMNISEITDGDHNITVYVRNSYDNRTSSTVNFTIDTQLQKTTIPEFSSWIILPLFMVTTLSAVIIYRRVTKTTSRSHTQ